MERRRALTWLVHGGSATVALVVGVPTLIYAISPSEDSDDVQQWATLGPVDTFKIGAVRVAVAKALPDRTTDDLVSQQAANERSANAALLPSVYVWRTSDLEFVVFSRSCTDLGCPVTFDQGSTCFFCPCHGGIFDQEGRPMAGPPDRPLYRYQSRIESGELIINLRSVPIVA